MQVAYRFIYGSHAPALPSDRTTSRLARAQFTDGGTRTDARCDDGRDEYVSAEAPASGCSRTGPSGRAGVAPPVLPACGQVRQSLVQIAPAGGLDRQRQMDGVQLVGWLPDPQVAGGVGSAPRIWSLSRAAPRSRNKVSSKMACSM